MNQKVKELLDAFLPCAKENLEQDGRLLPVAFVINKTYDGGDIIGCPWRNDHEKEMALEVVRKHAKHNGATAVVLITECWAVKAKRVETTVEEMLSGPRPSEHPERTEALHVYIETLDGSWVGCAPIVRDNNNKPSVDLSGIEYMPLGERHQAERIQNLLNV